MSEKPDNTAPPQPAAPVAEPGDSLYATWDFRRWVAALLLFGGILCFYWKLWSGQYSWTTNGDVSRQVLPWLQHQAREWQAGRFPAWDPNHWLGQPLVGQAQPGAVYPLNWLLFLSPVRDGRLGVGYLNLHSISIHLLAGWFAYLLGRSLCRTRAASLLCGLVYGLGGWLGSTDWPQMRNGAVWTPLVLLFVLRICHGERMVRNALFGGFFLGVSWLSGHHQQPLFTTLASAGLLCHGVWEHRRRWRECMAACAVFFGMAFMAGAAQILPAQEYGRLAIRWVGIPEPVGWETKVPFEIHKLHSLYPDSLLGIVFPGMHLGSNPHIGITAFALALLGAVAAWRMRAGRLLAAVGIGALIYALAHLATFEGWFYALVPIVEKARNPGMAVNVFCLAAAALAAFGLDALRDPLWSGLIGRLSRWLLVFGLLLFAMRLLGIFVQPKTPPGNQEALLTGFVAMLVAALFAGRLRRCVSPAALAVCLCGLFLAETGNTNSALLPPVTDTARMKPLTQMGELTDIAEFLKRQPEPARVVMDEQVVLYNFGDWHGVSQLNGFLVSMTRNLERQEFHLPHMKRLLGVGYAIRKEADDFHSEEVFSGRSGLKLWRSRNVLGRAFVVHEVMHLKDRREAPHMASELRDRLDRVTFVPETPPHLESCGESDKTAIIHYEPGRVEIQVQMACRGMVVLSDTWFPGWEATVDGRAARIWEAYGMVRGVVAEGGNHRIAYRYQPRSLRLGAILSCAALLVVVFARTGDRFVRKRPGRPISNTAG